MSDLVTTDARNEVSDGLRERARKKERRKRQRNRREIFDIEGERRCVREGEDER